MTIKETEQQKIIKVTNVVQKKLTIKLYIKAHQREKATYVRETKLYQFYY